MLMSTALESVSAGVCRSSTHLLFLSRDDQRSLRILALSILVLSSTELELFMLTAEILQMKWMKYAQELYQFTGKVHVQDHGETGSRSAASVSQDPPTVSDGRQPFTRTYLAGRYGFPR